MALDGFDLGIFLQPIRDDAPAGDDVRTDFSPNALYLRLRDARAEARAAERAADSDPALEGGAAESWRNVRLYSARILQEQAKDLEAAAWLTEALVRFDGLEGLAFGAALIEGLAARYWDQLYPMPDEDGIATRLSPVTGLNGEGGDGTLSQPLNKLRLFNGANGAPVMFFQYRASADLQTITEKPRLEARLKAGVMPFDAMQAQARAAGPAVFATLRRQVKAAQAAWRAMGETLDRLAGRDAPPTRRVADTLDAIAALVNQYAPPDNAEAQSAPVEDDAPSTATETNTEAGPRKRLATREDAMTSLLEISEYFRRTEPQSPIAYTIDEAIRRGRMSWPELMAELVKDQNVRDGIMVSLGIKPG
jgi:type VI secretion system protein ImpA